MTQTGPLRSPGLPLTLAAARRRWVRLGCFVLLAVPHGVLAQSDDLFRAYGNYEKAKAANQVPRALQYGNDVIRLTETAGGGTQDLVQLLASLGEFAGQA